jgi:predicted ATPase
MGLHAGEVEERDGDYFGPAVNTAARVCAAGHGGQILFTAAVHALADTQCLDLGESRLRDIAQRLRLFQVAADGLESEFPPVRSLDAVWSTLPTQRSSFVGRAEEVARVRQALGAGRLVSLCGPGGVGKTRLAVEVAHRELPGRGAAWFVDLSAADDSQGITRAFVSGCEVPVGSGVGVWDQVLGHLGGREALVVVDNCEHLIDEAAARVDEILAQCPDLGVVATSREPLGVEGEQVLRVPPLGIGAESAAVRLFVQRAAAAASDARVDAATDGVTGVCERLDGLPLAIELAAARCVSFTPAEIRDRLDDRFALLAGGRRAGADRHRTLEAAIVWSYDVLEPDEQSTLNALSVFPADFDLSAAAATAGQPDPTAAHVIDSLVAKSLLSADTSEEGARYRLLETIRAFATQRANAAGETGACRDRHLDHFVSTLDRPLPDGDLVDRSISTAARLGVERANYLAALGWADQSDRGDVVAWLAPRLYGLWVLNVEREEGKVWLDRALEEPDLDRATRGICLNTLLLCQGQVAAGEAILTDAITTGGSSLAENPDLAWTYAYAAFGAATTGRSKLARNLIERAESLISQPGASPAQQAVLWLHRGLIRIYERDFDTALDDLRASARAMGTDASDHEYTVQSGLAEAVALHLLGRHDEAVARCDKLLEGLPELPSLADSSPRAAVYRTGGYTFIRTVRAVASAALSDPGEQQERVLSLLGPDITERTPGLSGWLGTFGCLAELAGDHEIARSLLETSVLWPSYDVPMYWEYLRRASGWSVAELPDRQQSVLDGGLAGTAERAELLRAEVARLTTS